MQINMALGINGQTFQVEGTFTLGSSGDWETPPEPSEFEVDTVHYKDVDITEFMSEIWYDKDTEMFEQIECLIIEQLSREL